MEKKKADMTSTVLITVILAVIGFIIILLVYARFAWTESVNKETCHQSVIYRATLPAFAGSKEYVPLKCKTSKICITSASNGKCREFENAKGVTRLKVINKEQIEQAVAKEIVDCWETMGQGKLSLFSQWISEAYGFQDVLSSCVICSRVAFDKENLIKSKIDVKEIDVMNYMTNHIIPGKKASYYEYLAGEKGKLSIEDDNFNKVVEEISKLKNNIEEAKEEVAENISKNYEPDELSVMFMQVTAPKYSSVFKNTVYSLLGLGGFIAVSPLSKTAGKIGQTACGSAPMVCAVLAIVGVGIGAGYQAYTVFNNNAIAAGYCGDVSVGEKAETGCSVVRTVNYGVEDLSKYCSVIESIP
jgi:hypothetical protein